MIHLRPHRTVPETSVKIFFVLSPAPTMKLTSLKRKIELSIPLLWLDWRRLLVVVGAFPSSISDMVSRIFVI
jgi:hypothetical protein